MKIKNQNQHLIIILLIVYTIIPFYLNAQPSFDDGVFDVPVDGDLSLLIAGGIGFGVKKLSKNNKSKFKKNTN